jgi:hypothetical protein
MSAPTVRRFEGISFVNQPPQAAEKLPHMDIAVFVGYTSARPLNEPVMVEDAAQFEAIFGEIVSLLATSLSDRGESPIQVPQTRSTFNRRVQ